MQEPKVKKQSPGKSTVLLDPRSTLKPSAMRDKTAYWLTQIIGFLFKFCKTSQAKRNVVVCCCFPREDLQFCARMYRRQLRRRESSLRIDSSQRINVVVQKVAI